MADKEKLVKEQENKQRLISQQPLNPQPITSSQPASNAKKSPTAPKDLTSSLINSNLASMSLSSNQTLNYNFGPGMPSQSQPMYSHQGMMGNIGTFPQHSMSSQNAAAFGIHAPPPQQQQQPRPNMAALDNLMITSSNRPKLSMSQMQTVRPVPQQTQMITQPSFANFPPNQSIFSMNQSSNQGVIGTAQSPQQQMSQSSSISSELDDLLS